MRKNFQKLTWWIFTFVLFCIFTPQIFAQETYINHIISTGQSLAIGTGGEPALTTKQPFKNIMLIDSQFVPLIEFSKETISSAMANYVVSQVKNNDYIIEINSYGYGGASYEKLKLGTEPFNNHIKQVKESKDIAEKDGKKYRVTAITVIHGETDDKNISDYLYYLLHRGPLSKEKTKLYSIYENYLVEWQKDYEKIVKEITNQQENIPLITDQLSSFSLWSDQANVSIAQLVASEHNPGKIILVGPKYFLQYADGPHLTNYSYRWLGEYYGKVYKQVVIDKKPWKPLSPKKITRVKNNITVTFHIPSPPLVFDTSKVLKKENYGFEYYDDDNSAYITNVLILKPDTILLKLNTVPTGQNQRLRYAYSAKHKSPSGAKEDGSARGNVRDSDNSSSIYGNKLYNWLVHFDKSIDSQEKITIKKSFIQSIQDIIIRLFQKS